MGTPAHRRLVPVNPRDTNAYRTLRTQWLDQQTDLTCHWCHQPTSRDLPRAHPRKTTVDHLIEVDLAPDIALDTNLWVVACWTCNSARGARHARTKQRTDPNRRRPSRRW